jgi:hypothetical protein
LPAIDDRPFISTSILLLPGVKATLNSVAVKFDEPPFWHEFNEFDWMILSAEDKEDRESVARVVMRCLNEKRMIGGRWWVFRFVQWKMCSLAPTR